MTTTTLVLLFLSTSAALALTLTSAAASKDAAAATTFIRTCCASTSYPSLCLKSLSPYSTAVRSDPTRLALLAANASLPYVTSAATKSSALLRTARAANPSSPAAKALRDCKEVLGDALGNTKYSVTQIEAMIKLGAKTSPEQSWLWALSNAQTYMSAALTKEGTCADGLREMGAAAKGVRARLVKAEKYTTVALGLINRLRTYAN